jgi:hypothetical protein
MSTPMLPTGVLSENEFDCEPLLTKIRLEFPDTWLIDTTLPLD